MVSLQNWIYPSNLSLCCIHDFLGIRYECFSNNLPFSKALFSIYLQHFLNTLVNITFLHFHRIGPGPIRSSSRIVCLSVCVFVTALLGIYLLLFTIQQVLTWKYGLTTLGHKINQNIFSLNILFFLKNNNLISMSGHFCVFYSFCHWAYFISKKWFQNFECLNLGLKTAEEAIFASPVGPTNT